MTEDRNITYTDEKNRIIDFSQFEYEAPEIGVLEGELKYFACNAQWYPIIMGWVDHLSQIYAWKNAQDERHHGIQQILIFERGVELPELDCGDVENCIETSPTINKIINKGNRGFDPESVETPVNEGENFEDTQTPAITPVDCGDNDKDKLWGAISEFVDFCHAVNIDFLQNISQAKSQYDLLAIAIEAIPIIETFPTDEGIEVVSWFFDNLQGGYQAEVTTINLYQLKCDLFCAAVANDCEFTIEIAMDYFLSDIGATITTSSNLLEITDELTDLTSLVDTEWFSAITYLQISLPAIGEFFGQYNDLTFYNKAIQAGALSGDSSWTVWCDECNTPPVGNWYLILDFANDFVKDPIETIPQYVIRDAFTLSKIVQKSDGVQFTQKYKSGINYRRDSTGDTVNIDFVFSNNPTMRNIQFWGRNVDCTSNWPFETNRATGGYGALSDDFPTQFGAIRAIASGYQTITFLRIAFSVTSGSGVCGSDLKYVRLDGQGALPIFAS